MWHAERHVSDVTLVEIWKTGGWKANDFLSSVRKKGLWDLFLMKRSGHMIRNIRVVFLMFFNVIRCYECLGTCCPAPGHQALLWAPSAELFRWVDFHQLITQNQRILLLQPQFFGLCENVVLKIHFEAMFSWPSKWGQKYFSSSVWNKHTHSNPQMLDFLFY